MAILIQSYSWKDLTALSCHCIKVEYMISGNKWKAFFIEKTLLKQKHKFKLLVTG